MRIVLTLAAAALALLAPATARADDDGEAAIRDSVVKIFSTMRYPDLLRPWMKQSPRDASGTGVVISGKRILTNAHVVLYASQVFVQPNQSGEKLTASVEAVAPGIDLAIIKLEDESFFDKHPPLDIAEKLPEVKDSVLVYGYPTGGSSLSITKGIVSRIEFTAYSHETMGVRIQVDAAINPGNSGGPALVDGRMVGLIFSKLREGDNIGYIIPAEEIDLFFKDVADGHYDGKPMMHDSLQTFENEALRAKLGLGKNIAGMVVNKLDRNDDAYPLKKWDVITKVGDHEIDNVGMVRVKDDLRLQFHYMIQKLAHDGSVPFTIVREGKEQSIELPVSNKRDELVPSLQGKYPSYFVYGPLVFTSVTADLLGGFDRGGDRLLTVLSVIQSPLVTRRGDLRKFADEELVVIPCPIFPHKIAKGYDNPLAKVVKEINGVPIRNLRHMVETLRDTKDKYITVVFDDKTSESMVFDRQEIVRATDDILSDNGVRRQCSDDLAPIWEKKP
ncbi:MAG TPA: trypsin-like peptidase domain-containing protein [Isosphaeraceae bacterium]|nr:trypsin-like peptidase domain-containing protein [Isosphaeraceae bacterium]